MNSPQKVLRMAEDTSQQNELNLDFPGLHMIQRTQVYLREAIESLTNTLVAVMDQHNRVTENSDLALSSYQSTQKGLRYRQTILKSTDLRLQSMEKRTESTINLVSIY